MLSKTHRSSSGRRLLVQRELHVTTQTRRGSSASSKARRQASTSTHPGAHVHKDQNTPFALRPHLGKHPFSGSPASEKTVNLASNIRNELRDWQAKYGQEKQEELSAWFGRMDSDDATNITARPGETERIYDPDKSDSTASHGIDFAPDSADLETLDPLHRLLGCGDLVEIRLADASKDPLIAVFVRRLGFSTFAQFFTSNGKWIHSPETTVTFAIRNYIPAELVEKMIPHLPLSDEEIKTDSGEIYDLSVPREVSGPVVSRLLNFKKQVQDLYRRNAARLDQAHELIADSSDLKFYTLGEIAQKLLMKRFEADLNPVDLITVRLALVRSGFAFGWDRRHHRLTTTVYVRSKSQVAMVSQVQSWIRQFRNELSIYKVGSDPLKLSFSAPGARIIQSFAKRARTAIQESRKDRQPTQFGSIGPSKVRMKLTQDKACIRHRKLVSWNAQEQLIIRFIELFCSQRDFAGLANLEAQTPLIMKATGMYDHYLLYSHTGFVFLQEIGCLAPWDNRITYDTNVLLPSSGHSQMLAKTARDIEDPDGDPSRFLTGDALQQVRQIRRGSQIFCLDGPGAKEIDDGISVERMSDGTAWVHVHVANPTAFLEPDSMVSQIAQHMTETIYSPEKSHMMIPPWITQGYFSLDEGRPCLTFSARLDDAGNIVDYEVTAGNVKKFKFIDPEEVDKALKIADEKTQWNWLCVGGIPPSPSINLNTTTASQITPSMKQDLTQLMELAKRRSAVRSTHAGISFSARDRDVQVWMAPPSSPYSEQQRSFDAVRLIEGDPIIRVRTSEFSPDLRIWGENIKARDMVQEFMLLACYVGAKWTADRGLPNIYRGSLPPVDPSKETAAQFYNRVIKPAVMKSGGTVPFHLSTEYLLRSTPGTLSLKPMNHEQLGMTHYSRVTSPLRRYADMVTHWQIGAALIHESRTGQKINASDAEAYMPFSNAKLEAMLPTIRAREDRIKRAKRWGVNFWTTQLMLRAVHFGELELPETLTVCVTQARSGMGFPAIIKEYDIPCMLDAGPEAQLGDIWEGFIHMVDAYNVNIKIKPLRLISRIEQIN